jgi:hypothetical protein
MIFSYVFDSDESRESLLSLQTVFKRSKGPMANLKEDNKFFVPITSHIGIEPRTVRRFFLLFLSQNHEFRAVRAAGELGAVVSRTSDYEIKMRNDNSVITVVLTCCSPNFDRTIKN